jgi:probable addiction module antidote protein
LLVEALRDPGEAAAYLTAALSDGDKDVSLLALRRVAEAHGGIGRLSGRARLNRVSLYRMLSARGNPELRSLGVLLDSFGLRLAVEVREGRARRRPASRPRQAGTQGGSRRRTVCIALALRVVRRRRIRRAAWRPGHDSTGGEAGTSPAGDRRCQPRLQDSAAGTGGRTRRR